MANNREEEVHVNKTSLPLVQFGKGGPMVTKLGFGGIPIQQIPEADAIDVVRAAYDMGMRLFDTARGYTNSEERIGKALKDVRGEVFIVTKSGARDLATLKTHFETSLQQLGSDYYDLFLFHNVARPDHLKAVLDDGLLDYMRSQQAAGRVRMIGISSHQAKTAADCLRTGEFSALQFPYNYLEDQAEPELLPLCREGGIGFLAMKPLAGGALSCARTAISWCMAQPDVVAIPGLISVDQVRQAVAAGLDSRLSAADWDVIQKDRQALTHAFCRRCGYCLPCPQGIPVNTVVSAELFLNRAGWHRADAKYLKMLEDAYNNCLECGDCEQRCPYDLPLTKMVRETAGRLAARVRDLHAKA